MIIKYNNHLVRKIRLTQYAISYGIYFTKNMILYYSQSGRMIYFYINNIQLKFFSPNISEDIIIVNKSIKLTLNEHIYHNIVNFLKKTNYIP